jgi:hypothetical protein
LVEEVALQLSVTRDQAFIRDELEMMLSFLMAAHEEQDKHKVVETWVKQVCVVSYSPTTSRTPSWTSPSVCTSNLGGCHGASHAICVTGAMWPSR